MTAAANPRCRLALRTSPRLCALSPLNSFSNPFNIILKPTASCSRCDRLIDFHHQRRKTGPPNLSPQVWMIFKIHNPI